MAVIALPGTTPGTVVNTKDAIGNDVKATATNVSVNGRQYYDRFDRYDGNNAPINPQTISPNPALQPQGAGDFDPADYLADVPQPRPGSGSGGSKNPDYGALYGDYYNKFYDELASTGAFDDIGYDPVDFQARTQMEIANQVAEYLRPKYDSAIGNQMATERANRTMVDIDAASRGMGTSSWVTDSKNRISNASAATIAGLESDYNANLAANVLEQFISDRNMNLSNDQFNASNKVQVDEFNASMRQALIDAALNRAGTELSLYQQTNAKKGGGGGGGFTFKDLGSFADAVSNVAGTTDYTEGALKAAQSLYNSGMVSAQTYNNFVNVAQANKAANS